MPLRHQVRSQLAGRKHVGERTRIYLSERLDRQSRRRHPDLSRLRSHLAVVTPGKPAIHCSNDPLLGGDPALPNPEDLLLASLSACHMLWHLHLASSAKIVVHRYTDDPLGKGEVYPDGSGQFRSATLRP